ncbi:nucleotidyltransferase domain-containing protein [Thalassotalea sp. G20_0]|uniref:nucleotidyltransferase family protein n=1 Tax=Thalassotalea sp. G20_0 TaxID=2821093 RepID=UPI001ADB7499|nr:nucleotidyltransferase domain-containing protein [Thalassotalea sp. G20_0]MBO9496927.1 nucleotidyltransferase domain-containing protein [Thalassotalea sp. G20_0]
MKAALETLQLTASELAITQQLLKRYLPNTSVWAYGSRVNGNVQPASDLDLVAFACTEQLLAISELREAFEESNLPFRVDLFTWDQMPESFKETIRERYVVIQNGHD